MDDRPDEEKEEFTEDLGEQVEETKEKQNLIITGDLND